MMFRSFRLTLCSVVALACLFVPLIGCAGPTRSIDAAAIDVPLSSVLRRHDAYVKNDATLSDVERRVYLRSSAELTVLQDTAMGRAVPPPPGQGTESPQAPPSQ